MLSSDLKKLPVINKEIYFNSTKNSKIKFNNAYIIKSMANIDGEEAVFPLSVNDFQKYILFEKRKFELIGVKKTDLCSIVAFSSNHTIPMSQSLLALGASYIPLDGDEAKIFNDIVRYKVTVIFTIPPFVERLMEYVKVRNLRTSLRLVITTGVKIPDIAALNNKTKSILGAELVDTIGASEVASFAFSCKTHRNLYHFIDQYQLAEVLDLETREPANEGEIVITPLWKVDYPLFRYGTDNFTKIKKGLKCNCSVKNKIFFTGVERRLNNATRIQRYLVDLKDFYDQVRNSLLWQNSFDRRIWWFLEKPALVILIIKVKNVDQVLVFVEKNKFILTMRNRQIIEETIFKMTGSETKLILCKKELINQLSPNYLDLRNIPKKKLTKEVRSLLNLC